MYNSYICSGACIAGCIANGGEDTLESVQSEVGESKPFIHVSVFEGCDVSLGAGAPLQLIFVNGWWFRVRFGIGTMCKDSACLRICANVLWLVRVTSSLSRSCASCQYAIMFTCMHHHTRYFTRKKKLSFNSNSSLTNVTRSEMVTLHRMS